MCLCHLGIHFFAETEFLGQFLCEMRRRCDSADFTTGGPGLGGGVGGFKI